MMFLKAVLVTIGLRVDKAMTSLAVVTVTIGYKAARAQTN